jgi:hypothetical protein
MIASYLEDSSVDLRSWMSSRRRRSQRVPWTPPVIPMHDIE